MVSRIVLAGYWVIDTGYGNPQKKKIFYGRAIKTGGGKGPAIFLREKKVPTAIKLEGWGVKALIARPLKITLFFGFY